ncbi:beta-defensin 119-like [Pteropus medius]|uniref:Beta-defensin 119-like n=1 Tax=Pteropus vampyrus TaxID=132908 RepID=A0A6P3RRN2_PTEVA|nr:beta-defensin 119-like [Pteropus vampyrus]XP_039719644.1 beta-defensin 119-like [Pteropus giganteus]
MSSVSLFLKILIIIVLIDTYVSGKRHILRCMGNMGICRTSCKKDERPYLYCRNYQSCCLQSYMRISISGEEGKNDWSQENSWPKIS